MSSENMSGKNTNSEKFSIVKRAQSFNHAGRGIWIFLKTTHNVWIHMFVFVCVLIAGFTLGISQSDWIAIILASGAVFVTEAMNTAIEIHMDLTSPNHHPYARDTKDVAAGAVLIASIMAVVIGIMVFGPYLF